MTNYVIKKACALTVEEKTSLGIIGIPENWPIEMYNYDSSVPENFELISEEDLALLKFNNQAAYDAWVAALHPIVTNSTVQKVDIVSQPPFTSKKYNTNNVFKRIHGIKTILIEGENTITWSIPYNLVIITGIEITNSESMDSASLLIIDSDTGLISGIPNSVLNQFGFNVNMSKDLYIYHSEYGADLYKDLYIRIVYNSISAKTIGINFIINEVV